MGSLTDYEIIKAIGIGSYGEVHLVQHKKERKQYAVKKMALHKASRSERKAAELEAKLLSNLKHPNIVSYKDSFEYNDGYLYIVMGYAEGGDLYTRIREQREKNEYLSEVQVVRWFIQICMALQYLHQKHILHRDLKTQNIFLTKTKMVKVGDLSIARVLEGAGDMATTLIGTPYYMSPELFSNQPYNHKSDVWALGCCVYEMTTLKHAFNAKDMNALVYKILKQKMPKMPELYSSTLCDLIKSMLHQNAGKRPSVNRILRNSFIKKHIQLFLDESTKSRRTTSGRPRQSESSSRRTSTSSVQSRCSSRESNSSAVEPYSPLVKQKQSKPVLAKPNSKLNLEQNPQGAQKSADSKSRPPVPDVHESVYVNIEEMKREAGISHNVNNSASVQATEPHKTSALSSSYPHESRKSDQPKPTGSSSSGGSLMNDQNAMSEQPPSAKTEISTRGSDVVGDKDSEGLKASGDADSPGSARVSSARERRRREKQKKANKIKESMSKQTDVEVPIVLVNKENAEVPAPDEESKRRESSSGEEVNQFYTLLHTTLRLDSQEDSPPLTPDDAGREISPHHPRGGLSPVEEVSESAQTTLTNDGANSKPPTLLRNTPQSTQINSHPPPSAFPISKGISQGTLGSTARLMDRIVALRKDCIHGLGVPLLHRAYELLDGDFDEAGLEKHLIDLLGEVRFKQWAGKIWQLKFCEESIFKHCGSITAY